MSKDAGDLTGRLLALIGAWRTDAAEASRKAGPQPGSFDEVEWDTIAAVLGDCAAQVETALGRERETVWCEAHRGLANPHLERDDCVHPHYTDQQTRARINQTRRSADAAPIEAEGAIEGSP